MWSPTIYPDELYHHGIKGMKWGVRRYQNYDGTRTSAGLSRYGGKVKAAGKKLITAPHKSYSSTTTSKYKKNYGENDIRTKRSAELDKKIQEKYADDRLHKGKAFVKANIMGAQLSHTYNMSRAIGESRGKAFARSLFDINVAALIGGATGGAVEDQIKKLNSNAEINNPGDMYKAFGVYAAAKGTGMVVSDATGAAFRNTGSELSLQQRAIRKKYVNAPTQKKKKR